MWSRVAVIAESAARSRRGDKDRSSANSTFLDPDTANFQMVGDVFFGFSSFHVAFGWCYEQMQYYCIMMLPL